MAAVCEDSLRQLLRPKVRACPRAIDSKSAAPLLRIYCIGVVAARDDVGKALGRASQYNWSFHEALLVFHHGSSSSITCAMVRVGRRYLDQGPCDVNLTMSAGRSPRQACLDIPLVRLADNLRSVCRRYSHNLTVPIARDLMIAYGTFSHQDWPTGNASPTRKHTTVRAVGGQR